MKIETKFNIGESVWFLDGYKVTCANIVGIETQLYGTAKPHIAYRFVVFPSRRESEVFKTKKELIDFINPTN